MRKKKFHTYKLVSPLGRFSVVLKARKLDKNSVQWQKPKVGFRPICEHGVEIDE